MMSDRGQKLSVNVRSEDGSYWATVAEYPGVFATGDTLEELRESLGEGIALVLGREGEVTITPLQRRTSVEASSELVPA